MNDHPLRNLLFFTLMLLLAWLPLPFGSKPLWAMGIFQIMVWLLAAGWSVGYGLGVLHVTDSFRKAWPAFLIFFLVSLWLFLQSMPLPAELVKVLSPKVYDLHHLAAVAFGNPLASELTLSLDPAGSRHYGTMTLAYALLFALVLLLVNGERKIKILAWVLVTLGTLEAGYGVLSTLSGLEWGFFGEKTAGLGLATGTFVNRNNLAGYLEMTLAVGIGLMLSQLQEGGQQSNREKFYQLLQTLMSSKVLLRVMLITMVVGLVMTRSRMGNIAFFFSLLVSFGLYIVCRRRLTKSMVILFASLIVVDTIIVSQWFGLDQVVARIEQTQFNREARSDVNPVALEIIQDFSLTGTGGGSFYTTLPSYHDGSWHGFFDFAHNDYLQFPLEFGIPASLLLAGVVLWAIGLSIWSLVERRRRLWIGMAFSSFMGLLSLLVHSGVDFNLQIPANAAYFIVLISLAFIARYDREIPPLWDESATVYS